MYKLSKLLFGIPCTISPLSEEIYVTDIVKDSREVTPESLFICFKGCKADGHNYIREAEKRGARVIICSDKCRYKSSVAIMIRVRDPRSVYAALWRNAAERPDERLKIIAVTGTNGKTTVSTMIYTALLSIGRKCALVGTLGAIFNGEKTPLDTMTTPDPERLYPLLRRYADGGAEYVIMEASSHALALGKLDGIRFFVGAVTNVTPEHLDFHGNMQEYCKAKALLFSKCEKGVYCTDDAYVSEMYERAEGEKKSVSVRSNNADYFADNTVLRGIDGVKFNFNFKGGSLSLSSEIPGEFTVSNMLLSAAVLKELGLTGKEITKGLSSLHGIKGRMDRVRSDGDFSVFIDFAHTPDALQKLLTTVNGFKECGQRTVTLFGCGGDRDRSKRSLMGAIASRLSDFVIITSDNSRSERAEDIIGDIMSGFDKDCPHKVIPNRKEAITFAIEHAGRGDVILLCGKGHEEYEIDGSEKRPFSEREIVLEAVRRRNADGK